MLQLHQELTDKFVQNDARARRLMTADQRGALLLLTCPTHTQTVVAYDAAKIL